MTSKPPFKWRHFAPDIINRGVRWYCLYPLSYRNLEEMMCDRSCGSGSQHAFSLGPEVWAGTGAARCRPQVTPTNDTGASGRDLHQGCWVETNICIGQ